jgi:fucokinase
MSNSGGSRGRCESSFQAASATTASACSDDNDSDFPFATVVVTFPDARAAHAADAGPLQQLRDEYAVVAQQQHVEFLACTDPYGCRVGSGGGTLAALMDAKKLLLKRRRPAETNKDSNAKCNGSYNSKECSDERSDDDDDDGASILILHAGGASSRCPTQMVLGKAWTSFPCGRRHRHRHRRHQHPPDGGAAAAAGFLENPISILLKLCQRLFHGIPPGSIVVACSDVILLLPLLDNEETTTTTTTPSSSSGSIANNQSPSGSSSRSLQHISWHEQHTNSVLVLAVPTALETAKNHGVFVLSSNKRSNIEAQQQQPNENEDELEWRNGKNHTNNSAASSNNNSRVFPCRAVYQKPDWDTLTQHCAFSSSSSSCDTHDNNDSRNNNTNRQQEKEKEMDVAWTDTGIVVLLPRAAQALMHLAVDTELSACTARGLEQQWQQQQSASSSSSSSSTSASNSTTIQEFAAQVAPSIDLYTGKCVILSSLLVIVFLQHYPSSGTNSHIFRRVVF